MRNLQISTFHRTSVEADLPLTATAWDSSNDSLICAFGPTPEQPIIELKRKISFQGRDHNGDKSGLSEFSPITSWDAPCPLPELNCDEILLMHYFPDTRTVCIILSGGDLVLVREDPEDGQEKIEIVGSVDVGIAAAAWAPDEELLAVVTRSDNLVLMSRNLEPIMETLMTPEDLKASKHVSVGWGKKETQFQGKRAKAMRDPTMPEHVDDGVPSKYEDGKVNVSWRGDGAYLAVNSVVPDYRRVIRVYSREGVLDSVSEPVDGLESTLSWRPFGNLIASIKRSKSGDDSKLEVVFFERNGLRHGEFSLRLKPAEVDTSAKRIRLAWNIDSTVLALSLSNSVQYWTMGNYHYYLKQEVRLNDIAGDRCASTVWHPEKPLKCCIYGDQSIIDLEYLSHVTRGPMIKPYDYGIAAVIDGAALKLTPLKHAGVPPPMAFCEAEMNANIVDVAISSNGRRLAILTLDGIELCDWQMRATGALKSSSEIRHTTNFQKSKVEWSALGTHSSEAIQYTQVIFINDIEILVLAPAQDGQGAQGLRVRLLNRDSSEQNTENLVSAVDRLELPYTAQGLLTDTQQMTSWVRTSDSTTRIEEVSVTDKSSVVLSGGQANSVLFKLQPVPDHSLSNGHDSSFYKVSLTSKGTLLADQRVIARDCTSFAVTDAYLVYTTSQHLLKFVHLTQPDKMDVPGDTPEVDERCRSIERGARIVTVMPSVYAVVLQMPRGNLETIYPRVLVLTGIRESLRNLEYRTAFLACQNQQVDMNILHDYLPEVFMANIKKFIEDLKKPVRIDEFLSKLKEEDVTQTLYKDTLNAVTDSEVSTTYGVTRSTALHKTGPEKVNSICDAFISILKDKPGKFLQCVITAHVCKRPPDLTAALTLVSSLRQTSSEEADLAVSHLCFLTDSNRLYDAALALYDLELTLLVAQNAQRDPREYMPFLQNLQSLPPHRRQYQIDNHLRNHAKALTSLHTLEAHDEAEAYTIKHSLYTHAMELYKYSQPHLTKITTLYAEYLSSQSQHLSAATLYESLGLYTEAYPLYALAHRWRESLTNAMLIPLPPAQLQTLASSLATTCAEESRDFRSAATIHTEYLSDAQTAARLLCKGSYFADALRLLVLHNHTTSIPSTIDSGLGDKFSEILELVSDCKSQLAAQIPRIHDLRIKKAEDPLAFFGGDPTNPDNNNIDIPDNVSLAPTDATTAGGQSLFTRYGNQSRFGGTVASNASRKTSKTRRREERKRARGKKGSVYEEEYLVASVARLIERVNGVHDEVGRLVSGLLRRGMSERAVRVGEVMREIEAECQRARSSVWGVEEAIEPTTGHEVSNNENGDAGYRPQGADGVYWDSQQETTHTKEAPIVKPWKENELVLR